MAGGRRLLFLVISENLCPLTLLLYDYLSIFSFFVEADDVDTCSLKHAISATTVFFEQRKFQCSLTSTQLEYSFLGIVIKLQSLCVCTRYGRVCKNACTCRHDLGPKQLISEYIGLFPF